MKQDEPTYSLPELATLGEVTPRTIRYYIGQGLLPSPVAEGPNTRYTAGHLDRLQLIRELQREHLPLAEIRTRMERLGDDQVRDLLTVGDAIPEPRGTAFDYIQSVLAGTHRRAFTLPHPKAHWSMAASPLQPAMDSPVPAARPRLARASRIRVDEPSQPPEIESMAAPQPAPPPNSAAEADQSATAPDRPAPNRSQWDRISLAPDVELHIRRPLSRIQNRRVERLLAIARNVLEEDQP